MWQLYCELLTRRASNQPLDTCKRPWVRRPAVLSTALRCCLRQVDCPHAVFVDGQRMTARRESGDRAEDDEQEATRALRSFFVIELVAVSTEPDVDGDMYDLATPSPESATDRCHELVLDSADAVVRANRHHDKVLVWPMGQIDAQTSKRVEASTEKRSSSARTKRHPEHRVNQFR